MGQPRHPSDAAPPTRKVQTSLQFLLGLLLLKSEELMLEGFSRSRGLISKTKERSGLLGLLRAPAKTQLKSLKRVYGRAVSNQPTAVRGRILLPPPPRSAGAPPTPTPKQHPRNRRAPACVGLAVCVLLGARRH